MKKTVNIEEKRPLKEFELKYINSLIASKENKSFKIYNSLGSNWNLMFLNEAKFFISVPKTDKKCSPSIYGSLKHAEQYNEFIDLKQVKDDE